MGKRIISIFLVISMLCGLCACGKSASANEMKLVKTEGAARVTDENQVEQSIQENMNLYSGYGVGTGQHGFAWMNLDYEKLLKLNEFSAALLEKDGRKLKVVLQSGDMFFCVLEGLESDESLTLETGNMSMAIRGTCGILQVLSDRESRLVLLEGRVTVTDAAGTVRQEVETGQVLNLYTEDDGTASVTLREVRSGDILDFAREYIGEDTRIQEKIEDGGGITDDILQAGELAEPSLTGAEEIYSDVLKCYREMLAGEMDVSLDHDIKEYFDSYIQYRWQLADIISCNFADCPQYRGDGANGFIAEDPAALQNWKYAFHDIDGDGFPELLIADSTLEDGYGIRDCWTTDDGIYLHRVASAFDSATLRFTSNGYFAEVYYWPIEVEDAFTIYKRSIYFREFYNCRLVASVDTQYYRDGTCNFWVRDVVADEYVLNTKDEGKVEAYLQEHYPLIADTSFSWQPLN